MRLKEKIRKIKFRYWNTITKVMVKKPEIPFKEGWTIEQLFSERGWVWMQFTGLLDCNGKEIYEGDIVKYSDNGEEYEMTVKWEEAFLHFDFPIGAIDTEIIGNIHENKDLIK